MLRAREAGQAFSMTLRNVAGPTGAVPFGRTTGASGVKALRLRDLEVAFVECAEVPAQHLPDFED